MLILERNGIEAGLVPRDINGAATTGQWVSLKNYNHITIVIMQGAWAGGTPAVTLSQATSVAGAGVKAANIAFNWQKAGLTASTFTRNTVAGNTFNLPATANTVTVLEIDAEELDMNNGFDCIRVNVASPGANADLLSISYIMAEPRYSGTPAQLPDAKID